jgi:hypothetical protein
MTLAFCVKKGMRHLFCLLMLSVSFYARGQQDTLPLVTRAEYMEYENLQGLYSPAEATYREDALIKAERWFKLHDTSLLMPVDKRIPAMIEYLFGGRNIPSKALKYEIRSVQKIDDKTLQIVAGIYLNFPAQCLSIYKSDIRLDYDIMQKKLKLAVAPIQIRKQELYGTVYYYTNKKPVNKSSALETHLLLSNLNNQVKKAYPRFKEEKEKLWYVMADDIQNMFQVLGLYDCNLEPSNYNYSGHTIFDIQTNGCYPHEIVHTVFGNYEMNIFLTEGLATFFSNYSSYSTSLQKGYLDMQKKIETDTTYRRMLSSDSTATSEESPFLISTDFHYNVSATLLSKYYQKVGKAQFFKTLFEVFASQSVAETYAFLKRELKINDITSYLLSNPPPKAFRF